LTYCEEYKNQRKLSKQATFKHEGPSIGPIEFGKKMFKDYNTDKLVHLPS